MKKVLFGFAFILALAAAFAFKTGAPPITAYYKDSQSLCTLTGTTNESNCSVLLTSGTQCTINVTGNPLAFTDAGCTILYHP